MIYLYPVVLTVAAAIILVAVGVFGSNKTRRAWLTLAGTAVLIPAAFFAVTTGLSHPKPIGWETLIADDLSVLDAQFDKKTNTIWLWIREKNKPPRYYVMDWDQKAAEQLQDALREAERNGTGVMLEWPESSSLETREPKFYALPQPAMPEKLPPDNTDILRPET